MTLLQIILSCTLAPLLLLTGGMKLFEASFSLEIRDSLEAYIRGDVER